MEKILKAIGSFIVAAILVAIPIFFGVSLFRWPCFISILLGIMAIGEIFYVAIDLYYKED